ncbi:MAG: hypothetical protein IPK00_10425 [Deltaproteobacteria bacterium]|nr:hypothetical protein [Deltaproteobacteria bacterium]
MDEKGTDLGNARRLVRLHGEDLRYVRAFKKWFWWDGQVWRTDETGEVDRRARGGSGSDSGGRAPTEPRQRNRRVLQRPRLRRNLGRLEAMIALAQAERPHTRHAGGS